LYSEGNRKEQGGAERTPEGFGGDSPKQRQEKVPVEKRGDPEERGISSRFQETEVDDEQNEDEDVTHKEEARDERAAVYTRRAIAG
jgi:hypothetical protein